MRADRLPRVVTARDLPGLGVSRSQMRTELSRGQWQVLSRGVLLTRPDPPSRNDWILAGAAMTAAHGVISGWDAVRLRGLGAPVPPTSTVLVLARTGHNRVVGGVHIRPSRRQLSPLVVNVANVPVRFAPIARAVCDTALDYRGLDPVRALATSAVQRGLCTLSDLEDELDDGPQNWSGWLRVAIADVRDGAASIAEAELRDLCRAGGLPPYEANVPIVDERGLVVAVVDALWRDLRAALEVDSQAHHFLQPQWAATMTRHNRLTIAGLAVTHYPPKRLRQQPRIVVGEIDQWLRRRARELGVPYPPRTRTPRVPPEPYRAPLLAS